MDGAEDPTRRRLLAAALSLSAAAAWGRTLGASGPAHPRVRTLRLALVLPTGALPGDRARSVEHAVRFALADAAATLAVPRTALDVVVVPENTERGHPQLAHAGALATDGTVAAVLAATSPSVDRWLRRGTGTARAPWILLPPTVAGSIAPLPPGALQVGRDDLAVAGAVAGWLAARPERTLVVSDATPRAARFERALRRRLGSAAVWDVAPELPPSARVLEARLRAVRAEQLVLNTTPHTAGAWLSALRPLLARSAPTVVAPHWSDATLSAAQFAACAGLVWVSTWHPSMGGSERNWARRHRAQTGMVPGDAEAAAYSAALMALTAGPQLGAQALIRDILVPDGARFGPNRCLPHGTQVRRRLAGVDEYGWSNQQLLAAATPAQAFADRSTGAAEAR